ncbi:TIGR01906 family membrane protein [Pediococcus damnosus]|uniref:TIGR01906 family membrane protein n=1 Tax=Pediococcus damnosus TaxID=51663 RepID=UPI0030B8807E
MKSSRLMNGSKPMRLRRFAQWCAFHLFGISLAIFLVINCTFLYSWTLKGYHVLEMVDLTKSQIMHNYHQLIQYLSFPWVTHLKMTNFSSSSAGLQHFSDVKNLFMLNEAVLIISGIVFFFFIRELIKTKSLWRLIRPLQVAAVIPILVGVMMSISFDQFFIGFHELLFRNNDWMFDPAKDPIINTLPEEFFLQCFVLVFVFIECFYLFFILVGRKELKK